MSDLPPSGFEWLDDPVTIAVTDYIQRIAEAVYPDYPLSTAKNKVWLAIRDGKTAKKKPLHLMPAPPPFPDGHVFAEPFFRWLARRWPGRIPWLHPHYGHIMISASCRVCWGDAKQLPSPPSYDDLRAENERLHAENKVLAQRLARAEREAEVLRRNANKSLKIRTKIAGPNHRGGRGRSH